MKLCAIQPPYSYTVEEADSCVNFLVEALDRCDESCDLILLPEYSNAPTVFPKGECIPYAAAHTDVLLNAVIQAAKRCRAIVAVNFVADIGGKFRNCTRIFDSKGNPAGDYYKQHLPYNETAVKGMDDSYTFEYIPPPVVEVNGIRFGFLVCYDCYFEEYIAHLTLRKPDIVLVSSHQRGERSDILRTLTASLAFHANAFVLRSSVSMGDDSETGGGSMVAAPDGRILADFEQQTGLLICEIGDPHYKYMRSNGFGGGQIRNDEFVARGRTPWAYRAAGSMVKPGDEQTPYPRICAHRGFNTVAPENSLPAFAAAIALGAQEIELDVRETLDGELVVCHDDVIDHVSDGKGKIAEMTLAELRRYDFGAHFSAPFTGLQIALLEDVLKAFSRQVIINLHVKSAGLEFRRETMRSIAGLVRKYDFVEHLYIAAGKGLMEMAAGEAPELRRCMLVGERPMEVVEEAIRYGCYKLQLFKPHYNREMVEKAHAHNILCNIFWADDPEEARRMLNMGIDTILTNDYLRVAQVLKQ